MKYPRILKRAALAACPFLLLACEEDNGSAPCDTVRVTSVALDRTTLSIAEGGSELLTATVEPDDADNKAVVWSSDASDVVTVDENGRITACRAGTTAVTAITADGGLKASCTVTVTRPVTGVALDYESLRLMVTNTVTLKAGFTPAEATDQRVSWTSDNPSVATVDENGTVTAVAEGEAVVTVRTADGGFEARCPVLVIPPHDVFGVIAFRSEKEWIVGNQRWSDVVMSSRCKKDDFDSSTYNKVDCRQNPGYGDLYSFSAVSNYVEDLCPNGWRVPTREDFIILDKALGGMGQPETDAARSDRYVNEWGGEYGGHARDDMTVNQGVMGSYWSQELVDSSWSVMNAYALWFGKAGFINPIVEGQKCEGFVLRCVKDL